MSTGSRNDLSQVLCLTIPWNTLNTGWPLLLTDTFTASRSNQPRALKSLVAVNLRVTQINSDRLRVTQINSSPWSPPESHTDQLRTNKLSPSDIYPDPVRLTGYNLVFISWFKYNNNRSSSAAPFYSAQHQHKVVRAALLLVHANSSIQLVCLLLLLLFSQLPWNSRLFHSWGVTPYKYFSLLNGVLIFFHKKELSGPFIPPSLKIKIYNFIRVYNSYFYNRTPLELRETQQNTIRCISNENSTTHTWLHNWIITQCPTTSIIVRVRCIQY